MGSKKSSLISLIWPDLKSHFYGTAPTDCRHHFSHILAGPSTLTTSVSRPTAGLQAPAPSSLEEHISRGRKLPVQTSYRKPTLFFLRGNGWEIRYTHCLINTTFEGGKLYIVRLIHWSKVKVGGQRTSFFMYYMPGSIWALVLLFLKLI